MTNVVSMRLVEAENWTDTSSESRCKGSYSYFGNLALHFVSFKYCKPD